VRFIFCVQPVSFLIGFSHSEREAERFLCYEAEKKEANHTSSFTLIVKSSD
jgi:hypothetical protein